MPALCGSLQTIVGGGYDQQESEQPEAEAYARLPQETVNAERKEDPEQEAAEGNNAEADGVTTGCPGGAPEGRPA